MGSLWLQSCHKRFGERKEVGVDIIIAGKVIVVYFGLQGIKWGSGAKQCLGFSCAPY